MSDAIAGTNSDFLFIYEGKKTNPNGDPDMENKPRMDYDTKTNLVTDLRVKRNIREYVKDSGNQIFVDTLSDRKVTTDTMLNHIVEDFTTDQEKLKILFSKNDTLKKLWDELINLIESDEKNYREIKRIAGSKPKKTDSLFKTAKIFKEKFPKLNNLLLNEIIRHSLIDIRMFGGAFAISGFSRTYTGPIQLNWGYSLHSVEMINSNTIVTIMNEDSSTMGKDYRLYYSLIAFHGTINKHLAKKSGLTTTDVQTFREAIINSVSYKPTRSKSDQYAMFYLELEYQDNYNGYLRDLRDFIDCSAKSNSIRSVNDLTLDFSKLTTLINENIDVIKNIHLWQTPLQQTDFDTFSSLLNDNAKSKIKDISLIKKEE